MSRYVVQASWDDAPHLDEQQKFELLKSLPPHQRDARSKGIPSLGAGAIYPIPEEAFVIAPCQLPAYYARAYGMDVGWNRTAAIWGAWDRENDIIYAYSEHYRGQAEPDVHASAIRARGSWMTGAIDPAARGRNQVDGKNLFDEYQKYGLNLFKADNAVEAGITDVLQRLSDGRLKVFSTLVNLLTEYRSYQRDDNGKVKKINDHALDALRYLVFNIRSVADVQRPKLVMPQQIIADTEIGY